MKTKLIDHPQYYLLVDEEAEIKEGDYVYDTHFHKNIIWRVKNGDIGNPKNLDFCVKIIAHLPKGNAPKLEGVDLMPELPNDEEDVEQLAKDYYKYRCEIEEDNFKQRNKKDITSSFIAGYKAAKQSEKKYSEVIKLLKNICDWSSYKEHPIGKQAQQALDILQSLSTTTPIDFEVEMVDEIVDLGRHGSTIVYKPKVINGVLQGCWRFK